VAAVGFHGLATYSALVDDAWSSDSETGCFSGVRSLRSGVVAAGSCFSQLAFVGDARHLVHDLVIQRAEHRDTQALHAKLDELLRADKIARTELVNIDDEEPEAIEERRAADRKRYE
jgi:hypothetical protein